MASGLTFNARLHRDRTGKTHFISGMSDSHLLNALRLQVAPAKEMIATLTAPSVQASLEMQRHALFYSLATPQVNPENIHRVFGACISKAGRYAVEALLRDSTREEAAKILQAAFGRTAVDENAPSLIASPSYGSSTKRYRALPASHADDDTIIDNTELDDD